jgi:hypothetical protein
MGASLAPMTLAFAAQLFLFGAFVRVLMHAIGVGLDRFFADPDIEI